MKELIKIAKEREYMTLIAELMQRMRKVLPCIKTMNLFMQEQ